MKKHMDLIKTLIIALIVIVVFGGTMFGIHFYTSPLIEKNNTGAIFAPAFAVMPEAKDFEIVEDFENKPEDVIIVFKETSGKGYVFRVNATSQFSKEPMELSIAISMEGVISGINLDKTTESKPITDGLLDSFIGNDGTLGNVEITGGTTFTGTAIKDAVAKGFEYLAANGLIKEAVKTPEQILDELTPTLHTGLSNEGLLKGNAITNASGNIVKGYDALNHTGFSLLMKNGDNFVIAVTNNFGKVKVYDLEGKDITADNAAIVEEALAYQNANGKKYFQGEIVNYSKMMEGAQNFKEVNVDVFNYIAAAAEFDVAGTKYYGFTAKAYGFDSGIMNIYVIVDAEGKIVKVQADRVFIDPSGYVPAPEDIKNYGDQFVGKNDAASIDGVEIVAGATLSSKAFKQATKDALSAFAKMGGAE